MDKKIIMTYALIKFLTGGFVCAGEQPINNPMKLRGCLKTFSCGI